MPARPSALRAGGAAFAVLAVAAIAYACVLKLTVEAGGPIWLDEGWTLGIVDRPGWGAFAQQLRLDVNPPLYFLLLRGWTAAFGDGDGALRGFSTLAACLLPAAALLPGAGVEARDRWTWAALLALWTPGIAFAQEARGYALLTLLAAVQTVLFAHLLGRPSLRRATLWTAAAALTALTQHHALILTAAQGLALLALERTRVLRLWPAAFVFLPALAWDALQWPRIAAFGRPEHAWYPPITARIGAAAGEVLAGAWPAALCALALAGVAAAATRATRREPAPFGRAEGALWAAALTSVAGALLLLGLGMLKPSLAPRYLAPFAPGALLVPMLMLRGAVGWPRAVAGVAAVLVFAAAAATTARLAENRPRRAYQFETASRDLARAGVGRLAFLWDNPTDGALVPPERDALADAFFVRAHRPVQVPASRFAPARIRTRGWRRRRRTASCGSTTCACPTPPPCISRRAWRRKTRGWTAAATRAARWAWWPACESRSRGLDSGHGARHRTARDRPGPRRRRRARGHGPAGRRARGRRHVGRGGLHSGRRPAGARGLRGGRGHAAALRPRR